MSDGTADTALPRSGDAEGDRTHRRSDSGEPVEELNELEFVKGEIFANVWQTNRIARISPKTGHVTGWIDLAGCSIRARRRARTCSTASPTTRRAIGCS